MVGSQGLVCRLVFGLLLLFGTAMAIEAPPTVAGAISNRSPSNGCWWTSAADNRFHHSTDWCAADSSNHGGATNFVSNASSADQVSSNRHSSNEITSYPCPTNVAPPRTIADILPNEPNLSILYNLVKDAGLLPALDSTGPLTLFAPTNEAFAILNLPEGTPEEMIVNVLLYHVVNGLVELKNGEIYQTLSNGNTVLITVTAKVKPKSMTLTLLETFQHQTESFMSLMLCFCRHHHLLRSHQRQYQPLFLLTPVRKCHQMRLNRNLVKIIKTVSAAVLVFSPAVVVPVRPSFASVSITSGVVSFLHAPKIVLLPLHLLRNRRRHLILQPNRHRLWFLQPNRHQRLYLQPKLRQRQLLSQRLH